MEQTGHQTSGCLDSSLEEAGGHIEAVDRVRERIDRKAFGT